MVQAAQSLVGLAQSANPWSDSQELSLFISPLGESPSENRNGQAWRHTAFRVNSQNRSLSKIRPNMFTVH